ncbi:Gas vesicle protein G [Nonomuraea maritima]|uniref:Gas vesicle protein G n=1 Tax=Nonomuraea maritima TaxID=683260 RepID=A0A1G9A9M8_9ACTN|nr:gas vesicle protein GvpG [Nonomuraea maritima]SDK23534.1 Gas vesicle protein G [Nonomuraea maritima]
MGLVTGLLTFPLYGPLRGLVWLAQRIQEQAETELHNPASVRRRLEEIEEARRAGLISEEEERRAVDEALQRLTATTRR